MESSQEGTDHDNGDVSPENDNEEEHRNVNGNINQPYNMEEFAAENIENERISREGFDFQAANVYALEEQNREAYLQNLENEKISQSNIQLVDPDPPANRNESNKDNDPNRDQDLVDKQKIVQVKQNEDVDTIEVCHPNPIEDKSFAGEKNNEFGVCGSRPSAIRGQNSQTIQSNASYEPSKLNDNDFVVAKDESNQECDSSMAIDDDVEKCNSESKECKVKEESAPEENEGVAATVSPTIDDNYIASPNSEINTRGSPIEGESASINSRPNLGQLKEYNNEEDGKCEMEVDSTTMKNYNYNAVIVTSTTKSEMNISSPHEKCDSTANVSSPSKGEMLEEFESVSKMDENSTSQKSDSSNIVCSSTRDELKPDFDPESMEVNSSPKNTDILKASSPQKVEYKEENASYGSSNYKPEMKNYSAASASGISSFEVKTGDTHKKNDSSTVSSKSHHSSSRRSSRDHNCSSSTSHHRSLKNGEERPHDCHRKRQRCRSKDQSHRSDRYKDDSRRSDHHKHESRRSDCAKHESRRSDYDKHEPRRSECEKHEPRRSDCDKHETRRSDCDKHEPRRSYRDKDEPHRSDKDKSRRSDKDEARHCKKDKNKSHRNNCHTKHSSRNLHKHDQRNAKVQVNLSDLHDHCIKMKKPEPKSGEPTHRIHPRVPWTPHETITKYKHQELFRIETDPNGGATTCHLYFDEISHLPESTIKEIAEEFIMLSYSEDQNENANHVIGIVHGGANYMPDLLDYMADHYPSITVKIGSLTGRATQSITLGEYRDEAYKSYSNGTFRFAPLQELSICGVQGEEVGAYFPDFVKRLEESSHMFPVMPWRSFSVVATDNPRESNDGPIFWIRPGEQTLPSSDASRSKGRLAKGVSRLSEAREALFEDRTKPHADQIGVDGGSTDTAPTAAVGLLKAVNCGHPEHGGRATKDVVAFHAEDYNLLLDLLQIDVYEPPLRQCTMWLETAKLNSLRRQGVRFARMQLHDGDVYYLPRKIIHQFQTISAVASVAWHVRFIEYFKKTGAPNLHAPTGLNKGSVYYEKVDVPPYHPPEPLEPDDDLIVVKSPRKRRRRSEGEVKSESKMKIKTEKGDEVKKKTCTPHKTPALVLQPLPSSESRHDVKRPSGEKSRIDGHKNVKSVGESLKTETHVVSPIKLEKSGNSFCVVNKPTDSPAPKKPLKENIQFKKRKAEKPEENSCDVLGDIMSQMKKSKTD